MNQNKYDKMNLATDEKIIHSKRPGYISASPTTECILGLNKNTAHCLADRRFRPLLLLLNHEHIFVFLLNILFNNQTWLPIPSTSLSSWV